MENKALLAQSKEISCAQCGGIFFRQTFALRKISKLAVGAPQDIVIPMAIHRCDDCGTPLEEEMITLNKIAGGGAPPKKESKILT